MIHSEDMSPSFRWSRTPVRRLLTCIDQHSGGPSLVGRLRSSPNCTFVTACTYVCLRLLDAVSLAAVIKRLCVRHIRCFNLGCFSRGRAQPAPCFCSVLPHLAWSGKTSTSVWLALQLALQFCSPPDMYTYHALSRTAFATTD